MSTPEPTIDAERADLLQALDAHRRFLRQTVEGLSDDLVTIRSTVSELTLGGLIKHVALVEEGWARLIVKGPTAIGAMDEAAMAAHADGFRVAEGETLAGLLERYAEVAASTDELVRTLPSLDASHPLPEAPWFPAGTRWSARRVLLHILAETSQHAGHADLLRESIDGAKTMG
jgi:uncharacterized damage-inducible protein DinB